MVAQTWAWMQMMNDRVPLQGISAALDSTFSGDSPCGMCCAIAQERQEKQEQAPVPESEPSVKFFPVSWNTVCIVFPPASIHLPLLLEASRRILGREDGPLLPPPQLG